MTFPSRRTVLLGSMCALGGCSTLSSLNSASKPLDTYDLLAVACSKSGPRTSRTLLVAQPQASAALTSDRIMIKPSPASITYLPDARWIDEVPAVVQSLLIRSISETGRIAYVGRTDAGPIPDKALLTRIDAFEVNRLVDATLEARVDINVTIVNDADQRIVASRRFTQAASVPNDTPAQIVEVFQQVMNVLLPEMADWAIRQV